LDLILDDEAQLWVKPIKKLRKFYLCNMSDTSGIELIDRLQRRLLDKLPGKEAQWQMAASHRGDTEFDFNFNGPPVKSSVLLMLFERNGDYYFPLIQRPDYTGIHSGQIGLPGGKEEPQDKNRIATALRETEEEIGVDTSKVLIIGELSELYVQASNYNVLPVVGYLSEIPEYNPDPTEVSEVIECNVTDLIKEEIKKEKELIIRNKYKIIAPYFDINNHVVWGATAMMLSEFVTIWKEI